MDDRLRAFIATHYDTATGQWVAWVRPWMSGEPIGKGQTEIAAKEDLERLVKDSEK